MNGWKDTFGSKLKSFGSGINKVFRSDAVKSLWHGTKTIGKSVLTNPTFQEYATGAVLNHVMDGDFSDYNKKFLISKAIGSNLPDMASTDSVATHLQLTDNTHKYNMLKYKEKIMADELRKDELATLREFSNQQKFDEKVLAREDIINKRVDAAMKRVDSNLLLLDSDITLLEEEARSAISGIRQNSRMAIEMAIKEQEDIEELAQEQIAQSTTAIAGFGASLVPEIGELAAVGMETALEVKEIAQSAKRLAASRNLIEHYKSLTDYHSPQVINKLKHVVSQRATSNVECDSLVRTYLNEMKQTLTEIKGHEAHFVDILRSTNSTVSMKSLFCEYTKLGPGLHFYLIHHGHEDVFMYVYYNLAKSDELAILIVDLEIMEFSVQSLRCLRYAEVDSIVSATWSSYAARHDAHPSRNYQHLRYSSMSPFRVSSMAVFVDTFYVYQNMVQVHRFKSIVALGTASDIRRNILIVLMRGFKKMT